MSEWTTYQLGEITEWYSGGTPSKQKEEYWNGEIPWISARSLKGTRVSDSDLKITQEGLDNGSRLALKNDLLLLVRGSGLFNSIPISIVEKPVAFNQDIKAIRIKKEFDYISPWFLLYWFYGNTRILNGIMEETGIGAGKFDLPLLKDLTIEIPPQKELEELTKTFKSIDDKLILLRQQNQTLEELAQTLFKRWFVEFEFPCLPSDYRPQGQVNLSEMAKVCTYQRVGGLPAPDGNNWFIYVLLCEDGSFYKGMTNDIYRRFYEHYTGQGAKHTKAHKPKKVIHWEKFDTQDQARKREEELKSGYGRTWIQRQWEKVQGGLSAPECQLRMAGKMVESELGEIPEGWEIKPLSSIANYLNGLACQKYPVVNNEEKLPVLKIKELGNGINENTDWATSNVDSKYIIESGDIIFSWSGTLMLRIWDGETCVLNQHLFKVTSDVFPDWFIFQWTNFHLNHFIAVAKSKATTMGHIKRSHLDEAMCFIPNSQLLGQFDGAFKTLLESFKNNNREIYSLTQLRDTLLPKLMSGELKVKELV